MTDNLHDQQNFALDFIIQSLLASAEALKSGVLVVIGFLYSGKMVVTDYDLSCETFIFRFSTNRELTHTIRTGLQIYEIKELLYRLEKHGFDLVAF